MCTGACSKFIAVPLYILAAVSIICNIMLFFPDFDTEYAVADRENQRITQEVKYMGGLIGGGIMVSRFDEIKFSVINVQVSKKVQTCQKQISAFTLVRLGLQVCVFSIK